MRVIGGKFRSRVLKFPRTRDVRPATERLKKVIFDTLGGDLTGKRVLDLYAGSGSLGIEALSRGAAHVIFVDHLPASVKCISQNLADLGIDSGAEIMRMDAPEAVSALAAAGAGGKIFDVIFIDPPYNQGLVKKTLLLVDRFDILSPLGTIVMEHARQEEPPPLSRFVLGRTNRYGITCLSFLYGKA